MGVSHRIARPLAIGAALLAVLTVGVAAPAEARVRRDPCLTGTWRMGSAASTALLQDMVGLPNFTVTEGTLTMTFGRGEMKYGSTLFILKGDIGGTQFVAEASFLSEAPYRTRAGNIVTRPGSYEINYGTMSATSGGETHSVPGPPGRTEATGGGSTPYTCSRNTLRYAVPLAGGGATMSTFRRA